MTKPKTQDGRNIIDYYHYWETEAIKIHLNSKRHNFSVLCSNLANDFNLSTVLRNCNAFLGKNFYVYGRRKFDMRGAVGTNHYENIIHLPEEKDLDSLRDFYWVGIDNIDGAKQVNDYSWPQDKHVLMCFGQEHIGLPLEILSRCSDLLYISQYGSVRSLNVGSASSIMMFDYCNKIKKG